jgi:hypothetical protein
MNTRKPATPPPDDPSDPLFGPAPKIGKLSGAARPPRSSREPGDDEDEVPETPRETPRFVDVAIVKATPESPHDTVTTNEKTGSLARGPLGDVAEYGRESVAVAAQVKAMMQGRIVQALQRPRSVEDARVSILRECKRTAFAKAAIYKKPVGGNTIEGLSIRFAETALRLWGNVASESIGLFDDDTKKTVRILVVDLETNTWHARDVTILKRIERKQLRRGQTALGQRVNSYGDVVFDVEATEDEMATKEANVRSKVLRNEGLRLIPADILDEARLLCKATLRAEVNADPDAARKSVADAFAELGVRPSDLAQFLGCEIAQASPSQIADLRTWYTSVRDGDTTWQEILAARVNDLSPDSDEAPGPSAVARLKARIKG